MIGQPKVRWFLVMSMITILMLVLISYAKYRVYLKCFLIFEHIPIVEFALI